MDHIIQALERAKIKPEPNQVPREAAKPAPAGGTLPEQRREAQSGASAHRSVPPTTRTVVPTAPIRGVELAPAHLEANRIVAHDTSDLRSRSFDMLRTQILQEMSTNGWRLLAVTSPTAGCGKTFTAINLALSIARQAESPVMLVDLDLQKPQVAVRLGIECPVGLRAVLEGRAETSQGLVSASIEACRIKVLAAERPSSRSSDWMASNAAMSLLEELKADPSLKVVILDLPPMLSGDDVISILPQVDCVLLVASAGKTTTVELKECSKYLKSTPLVRIVLNKVPEPAMAYY